MSGSVTAAVTISDSVVTVADGTITTIEEETPSYWNAGDLFEQVQLRKELEQHNNPNIRSQLRKELEQHNNPNIRSHEISNNELAIMLVTGVTQQQQKHVQLKQQHQTAVSASKPVPKSWHTSENKKMRNDMINHFNSVVHRRMPNASPDWQENIPIMSKLMESDLYQQAESIDEYLDPLTLGNRIRSLVLSTVYNNTNSNNNDNNMQNFKAINSISTEGINVTSRRSDISIHSSNNSNRITKRKKTVYDDDDEDYRRYNTGTLLNKLNQVDIKDKKKPKGKGTSLASSCDDKSKYQYNLLFIFNIYYLYT
jgi:hypothetical protein